jgi:hypothetical protein
MKSPPQVHTDLARNERSAFPSFRRNLLQRAEEGRSKQTSRSDRSNRGTLQEATDDLPSRPQSPSSVISAWAKHVGTDRRRFRRDRRPPSGAAPDPPHPFGFGPIGIRLEEVASPCFPVRNVTTPV